MSMTITTPSAALTDDERAAILEAVRDFAQTELAPHALEWDEHKTSRADTLRRGGELGLGGIYVREDLGGSGAQPRATPPRSSRSSPPATRRSPRTSRSTTWSRG